jgi:hypothetical protein
MVKKQRTSRANATDVKMLYEKRFHGLLRKIAYFVLGQTVETPIMVRNMEKVDVSPRVYLAALTTGTCLEHKESHARRGFPCAPGRCFSQSVVQSVRS